MNPGDFENQLRRQPVRPVPAEWRGEILAAAKAVGAGVGTSRSVISNQNSKIGAGWLAALNGRLAKIFWPHPAAWAGLAGVWVVISVLNWSATDHTEMAARKTAPIAPDFILAMQEQRRMLARLIETTEPPTVEPPKPTEPRPLGELKTAVAVV
jgi:hypothetical protein